jgi:hypothetical protein
VANDSLLPFSSGLAVDAVEHLLKRLTQRNRGHQEYLSETSGSGALKLQRSGPMTGHHKKKEEAPRMPMKPAKRPLRFTWRRA